MAQMPQMSQTAQKGQTFGRGRRFAILINVVLMVTLALAAAGIGIYLTGFTDLRRRFDLTDANTYTLSAQTRSILESLQKDVEVITVFDKQTWWWDHDRVRPKAMQYVLDLLQEYRVRGRGRLAIENLDPGIDDERIRSVYEQYNLNAYNLVIVRHGDNKRILGLETDLADFDLGSYTPVVRPTRLKAYRAEESLSAAIHEVTKGEPPKIYALTGHAEMALSSGGGLGASLVAHTLGADNMIVEPLSLLAAGRIPDDASAVLMLSPSHPFTDEERVALDAYVRRGGRFFIALAPFAGHGLEEWLRELGVVLEAVVVCHTQSGTLTAAAASEMWVGGGAPGNYGIHPIVDALRIEGQPFKVIASGGIAAVAGREAEFTSLMTSHPDAFGDLRSGEGDRSNDFTLDPRIEASGQRILGAVVEPKESNGARIVVLPGAASITNYTLAQSPGNETFLRRAVAWLIGTDKKVVTVPPRTPRANVADLREGEEDQIFLYTSVYLPLGALVLALLVWWARRK